MKKLICFDMDGTLVSQNSWYKLNLALGLTAEQDKQMYDLYGAGKLTYEDWTKNILEIYKQKGKASKGFVGEVLSDYELVPGVKDLVDYLRGQDYELAIISGSFDVLVDLVAIDLGIKLKKGNTKLIYDDRDMVVDIESGGEEVFAKLEHLKQFCAELNIGFDQCICIGDGANDRELFKATGKGITFSDAPKIIRDQAWKVVDSLVEIKNIL